MAKMWDFKLHSYQEQLNEGISEKRRKKLLSELKIYCDEIGTDYSEVCNTMKIDTDGLENLTIESIDWLNEHLGGSEKWNFNIKTSKVDLIKDSSYKAIDDDNILELPEGINFGHAGDNFIIRNCSRLNSFKGFPDNIEGKLDFSDCGFESLEGCPSDVGSDIDCSDNKLTSLEGVPEVINGDFNCSANNLTTLENGPKIVKGHFNCSKNQLTTLEGGPEDVSENNSSGTYRASDNKGLVDLKGFPNEFHGKYIHVNKCNLHSLQGIDPRVNKKEISCKKNNHTYLALNDVYEKAREYESWPAAYLWLLTTDRYRQMSKIQKDPIRESLSPANIKEHSLAFSKVWNTDIMEHPRVANIMKKADLDAEFQKDATFGAEMDQLGF